MEYVIVIISCYIFGMINPALIIARIVKGIDIRDHNSKNPGTSNAALTLGMKYGVLVGVLDILKGLIPVIVLRIIFKENDIIWVVGGLSAIIGHVYPAVLKLRGGKGTATFGGVVMGLMPIPSLILLVFFFIVTYISDFIAIATLAVVIIVPVLMIFLDFHFVSILLIVLFSALSIYKHYPNFKRIIKGNELGLKHALKKPKEKQ